MTWSAMSRWVLTGRYGVAARSLLSAAFAGVLLSASPGTAAADKYIALVVGNSTYQHTRTLPNPRNDVDAISKVLNRIGFKVTSRVDLGYRALREELREFSIRAQAAEVALIHFAGHGLELAGENYIVPIDARLARDVDLEYEAVTLSSLLRATTGAKRLRVVILDACRNNPLGDRMALSTGLTRSVNRGLARVEPQGDVLVAFSAKAGTLAKDGEGQLSPYADALVKHLATPGLDVRLLFGRVRDDVLSATRHQQEPFIYGSLKGDVISFVPSASADQEATQRERARFASEAAAKAKADEAEARRQAEEAGRKRKEAEAEAERLRREAQTAMVEAERQRRVVQEELAANRRALEQADRQRREAQEARAEAERQRLAALQAEEQRRAAEEAERQSRKFGAIAVSDSTRALGWSYDHPDRESAEASAIQGCAMHAGDCRIGVWFRNGCGAIAFGGPGGWGAAFGSDKPSAEQNALNTCGRFTFGCYVSRWVCTSR